MVDPCANLTVVELASVLAGPTVGTFFAERGARVIKYENARTKGDVTRSWKSKGEATEAPFSAYYASANWGKEVIMADLREPSIIDQLNQQLQQADVLLTNFPPASAARLGLSPQDLRLKFPHLVIGEIAGFGKGDDRPAYDVVLQAETGWISMTGTPDGPPAKLPVALIDILAAHQLIEGLLIALWARSNNGNQGAHIQVTLRDAAVAALVNQATNYLMVSKVARPLGTRHPNIAPYGDAFRTQDERWMVTAIGSDAQFKALCIVLGHDHWADDARFKHNTDRLEHREVLTSLLGNEIYRYNSDDLLKELRKARVPVGLIRPINEVLDDERIHHLLQSFELPDGSGARRIRTSVFTVVD